LPFLFGPHVFLKLDERLLLGRQAFTELVGTVVELNRLFGDRSLHGRPFSRQIVDLCDRLDFNFKDVLQRESMQINMTTTGPNHLPGRQKSIRDFSEEETRMPYETSPDGNSVILEEQMAKMNETAISHRFTNEIYNKQLAMFRIALTGHK